MKYFNRHECMKRETLNSISKVISDLFRIDGISPFGGISNMLYGLYVYFLGQMLLHVDRMPSLGAERGLLAPDAAAWCYLASETSAFFSGKC